MKIYQEISLSNFEFWGGAKCRAEKLTEAEFDQIEAILSELYPEGESDTFINDFFWFDEDSIAEWLGYSSFEEIYNRE